MWKWTAILSIPVLFIACAIVGNRSRPCPSKENFDRVNIGMTKSDVIAILGTANMRVVPNGESHLLPGYVNCEWDGALEADWAIITFDSRTKW
ncbi:MAG TPA: hypothetical protein VFE62_13715 [Gemmataceae bacterium]|nr:hypothetical protein [Gemmataceae bacterium]